jgi:hypothetical protein
MMYERIKNLITYFHVDGMVIAGGYLRR